MQGKIIRDQYGNAIGIACARVRRADCQTKHCSGWATKLCDAPVLRNGKMGECGRHICDKCVQLVEGKHFCPPHARVWDRTEGARRVTVCAACLTVACWSGAAICKRAGYASITTRTVAELRQLKREHHSNYSAERVQEVDGQ